MKISLPWYVESIEWYAGRLHLHLRQPVKAVVGFFNLFRRQ